MKIAVYTIALNEQQFVERWYSSAKEADYLLIADTGSTDLTVKYAENLGINVIKIAIKPWRFDDARNAALAALPGDVTYAIALDMDEQLQPGWRQELEQVPSNVTRPRYKYTWSWKEDGTEGLTYGGDKIHARFGYRWKHPVHEVLVGDNEVQGWCGLEIHHHPDNTKSRSQYLPLLELAVREAPNDDRNTFYYARELYFNGRNDEAYKEFKRHLKLPTATWKPERAASMRYLAKLSKDNSTRKEWLQRAVVEAPDRREARVELAQFYYESAQWATGLFYAKSALNIKEKPLEYLCEEDAWGFLPYDLGAICAYRLDRFEEALSLGRKAVQLAPNIERLKDNLKFYEGAVNEPNDTACDSNCCDDCSPIK